MVVVVVDEVVTERLPKDNPDNADKENTDNADGHPVALHSRTAARGYISSRNFLSRFHILEALRLESSLHC
jgi:hypothetical protein